MRHLNTISSIGYALGNDVFVYESDVDKMAKHLMMRCFLRQFNNQESPVAVLCFLK